jgi:hypothetical protein
MGAGMTITLTREEAQQVLDVIERNIVGVPRYRATELLRARLSAPEPEPVAWGVPNTRPTEKAHFMMLLHSTDGVQYPELLVPLYTAPPQREWQGLTDEEYEVMAEQYVTNCYFDTLKYARAIEAKLKEKNASHL